MSDRRPGIYVSGALNAAADIEKAKRFYERLGDVCENAGFNAYVPHTMGTDPVENPEVTPEEVYRRDMAAVSSSDLVVAYVGEPSLGVGAEIERAANLGIDVILLHEEGRTVSRLILGSPPVVHRVVYACEEEGLQRLTIALKRWKERATGSS